MSSGDAAQGRRVKWAAKKKSSSLHSVPRCPVTARGAQRQQKMAHGALHTRTVRPWRCAGSRQGASRAPRQTCGTSSPTPPPRPHCCGRSRPPCARSPRGHESTSFRRSKDTSRKIYFGVARSTRLTTTLGSSPSPAPQPHRRSVWATGRWGMRHVHRVSQQQANTIPWTPSRRATSCHAGRVMASPGAGRVLAFGAHDVDVPSAWDACGRGKAAFFGK